MCFWILGPNSGCWRQTTEESKLDKAEGGAGWQQGSNESCHFCRLEIKKMLSRKEKVTESTTIDMNGVITPINGLTNG